MRVRIKFTKTGTMRFIGHLDVMRFFQKVLRRAGLDVMYSEGFSPHMLMSFAQPLGVGVTSEGEYFDLDLNTALPSAEMIRRINEEMPPEASVTSVVQISEDKASKCMTLVAAADYRISFQGSDELFAQLREKLQAFFAQTEIVVLKKTKRSEKMMNIRPLIYEADVREDHLFLRLSSGSVDNLKPQLVMETFFASAGIDPKTVPLQIHRLELYARRDDAFVPLCALGEEII